MTRLSTHNNRRRIKALSRRQINVRHARETVRRFRKFYPNLRAWQRQFAAAFIENGGTVTGRMHRMPPEEQRIHSNSFPDLARQVIFLDQDFGKTEARILATLEHKGDIHSALAKRLFGEVNDDTRGRAKDINYHSMYGMGRDRIAKKLGGKK